MLGDDNGPRLGAETDGVTGAVPFGFILLMRNPRHVSMHLFSVLSRFALLILSIGLATSTVVAQAATESTSVHAAQTASAPSIGASAPVVSSVQNMKREIDALQGLIEGRVPRQISLPALFEIDLTDPAAVAQRIEALQVRSTTELPHASDEAAALRITRDNLRLAFLRLPVAQRDALREQDRLRSESDALEAEKARSVASLTAAEGARNTALAAAGTAPNQAERELATEEARLLAHLSEWSE